MNAPAIETPATGLRLFHSPLGLFDFQAEAVARSAVSAEHIAIYPKGCGKTPISLALACLLFEDDLIDIVLMVGEAGKIKEFARDDVPKFTDLSVAEYAGPITRRKKILANPPQVLVLSYETGRNDICTFRARSKAVTGPGMLTEFLRGKRVLILLDEVTKLRTRSSKLHVAWDYLINRALRRQTWPDGVQGLWVVGLTANTIVKNPEDHFNVGLVLAPDLVGTVKDFQTNCIKSYDIFDNPSQFKNISAEDHEDPHVTTLVDRLAPVVTIKSKSDPDVRDQFPRRVENRPTLVELSPLHRDLLEAIAELFPEDELLSDRENGLTAQQYWNLIRQAVAHPGALIRGQGEAARRIVAEVGADTLMKIGSAKVEAMIDWARSLGDDSGVIFTFYGPSVIPILGPALIRAGFTLATNHSAMDAEQRWHEEQDFKARKRQIFLSSDAGAKGKNLGIASALLHYEPAVNYDTHDQRCDRISRIDTPHDSVTVDMLVATGTPDVHAYGLIAKRQKWAEQVVPANDDEDPGVAQITAADRRRMLQQIRRAS